MLIRGRFSFSISRGIWGLALGGKMNPNMMYLLLKGRLEMCCNYRDISVLKFEVKRVFPRAP